MLALIDSMLCCMSLICLLFMGKPYRSKDSGSEFTLVPAADGAFNRASATVLSENPKVVVEAMAIPSIPVTAAFPTLAKGFVYIGVARHAEHEAATIAKNNATRRAIILLCYNQLK
mmetsp:Transcript_29103/g.48915  ORF Transcript_29103/g.48915 Transcript_29103/m.48915 type:complete len:116 (-) Transcript_29103:36-383(-)